MSKRAIAGVLRGQDGVPLVQLQRALLAAPEEMRRATTDAAAQQLAPGWAEELQQGNAFSPAQRKIVTGGAHVMTHWQGMRVFTGSTHPELTRQYEFGYGDREKYGRPYWRKSKNGGRHGVLRRTALQLPPASRTGWIAYPAAGRFGKRVFSMFLQIVVKYAHDAVEGKTR